MPPFLVVPSAEEQCVELFAWRAGCLEPPLRFSLAPTSAAPVSLDSRLKEALAALPGFPCSHKERSEHLALVTRWFYSSFRRGELILFSSWERLPYRKIVHACSRVLAPRPAEAQLPSPPSGTAAF